MSTPPRWGLSNVYPSLESREFEAAIATVKDQIDGLEKLFAEKAARMDTNTPVEELSASTGEARAADLAGRFGIDIRSRKFWEDSLGVIARRIERYCEL
jgi:hypothetical protein